MLKKLLFAAFLVAVGAAVHAQGTVIWSEDFESGTTLPAGWTQTTAATDGGWKVATTAAHSSTDFPIPTRPGNVLGTNDDKCNCNKANEIVYLPKMDLSGHTDLRMLFDIFYVRGTYQAKTESLKLLASTDDGTTWTEVTALTGGGGWRSNFHVNIAAYAGLANVQFAFRYDDGTGWLFGAMLDNIRVVAPDNVVRARLTGVGTGRFIDAVPTIVTTYDKIMAGHEVALRGTVTNFEGFVPLTSFDILVTRGAETKTYSYTNQNLGFNQSVQFFIPYPAVLGANTFDFSVELANVNGVGDADPSDNTGTSTFSILGVEPQPGRKVVVEEGTGTWCTWCPRGAVMMDFIAENYPDLAIPIAVHNSTSDPMRNAIYDAGMLTLIGGFPGGLVEREADIDPLLGNPNFEKSLIEHLTQPAKILVSQNVEWDAATRKVDVTSSLQFLEEMNGDFRIAVAYTEEGVTGTTSGYNQVNAYSGGGQGPMGGFENLVSPVPAAQMVYSHVARQIVGGFTGAAGSVPVANPAGSVMSYQSSYNVPPTYNIDNMHVITMVIDNATGRIINAESTAIPFVSTSAPTLTFDAINVSLAPNPVQDAATLTIKVQETADVQIRVVDAFGRVVSEHNYDNISGKQFLPFRVGNLPNGMYTLVATAKGQVTSRSFVIQR
ncbi:MAG: choice-of-anchor J domain-containing protein [Lewinellaceae bacterium]|nr:choice-of-anchor J domain-containing protein [Lewinellaceae bacterium]